MAITTTAKGLVTVFGGSGFVGRHVVRALLKRGWRVRAAVRRPDLAGHLQPLGMVGWVQPMQANLRYRWSVDRAVEGADAVVNLVAILSETGRQRFDAVHDFGARAVAEAARGAGLKRVVHMSAIGADADSPSAYPGALKGSGRSRRLRDAARLGGLPPVDRVRAGGPFLQPLRLAGAAVVRRCRCSAADTRASSRSSSATWRRRLPTRSRARRSRARPTNSAGRR